VSPSARRPRWLEDLQRVDAAVYAAIAATPSPALDRTLSRLSEAADYSRLWIGSGALLALLGGPEGRRAAALGLGSLAVTATVVNLGMKPLGGRRRPDRQAGGVPLMRHVPTPDSSSFPSGHSAAAFAFATGVGHTLPHTAVPIRALAALVAYSRVHTGVHYPGDVLGGALIGAAIAQVYVSSSSRSARMIRPAASISARWENACGKFPRWRPVGVSSSHVRPLMASAERWIGSRHRWSGSRARPSQPRQPRVVAASRSSASST